MSPLCSDCGCPQTTCINSWPRLFKELINLSTAKTNPADKMTIRWIVIIHWIVIQGLNSCCTNMRKACCLTILWINCNPAVAIVINFDLCKILAFTCYRETIWRKMLHLLPQSTQENQISPQQSAQLFFKKLRKTVSSKVNFCLLWRTKTSKCPRSAM